MSETNEPTIWSDDPPSELGGKIKPGWYWVRHLHFGVEFPIELGPDGEWYGNVGFCEVGPRVLGAAETVDLMAKAERLERENAELREKLTVDDLDELERYRSPLDEMVVGFDVAPADGSPSRHALIRQSELDQLRAQAAQMAEIHRVWRLPEGGAS